MKRIGFWLTLVALLSVLAACGRRGVTEETGTLQVEVSGSANAQIEVVGPGGYTQQLTGSQTLTGLAVGTYTVSAAPVAGFTATVAGSPAEVRAGATTRVRVTYQPDGGGGTGGAISGTVSIVGVAETTAPFVPGEIIVRFKSDLKPGLRAQAVSDLEPVRELGLSDTGLYRLTPELRMQSGNLRQATLQLIAQLSARDDVRYAHPNYLLEATAEPNDPLYDAQWHLRAINLPAAWDTTTGSSNVTVAVLDSGILPDHPDLESKLEPGYDFVGNDGFPGDGDGRDGDPTDPDGSFHGSHVAGTIAAATNNGVGIAGVSWGTRLLPVRVLGVDSGTLADAIDGILWSVGEDVPGVPDNPNPADILNLSLGGPFLCGDVPALQEAFDEANAAGAAVVVAAGNNDEDASGFTPASCGGVITVGATDLSGGRASYSNFGSRIDVMAPGGDITRDDDDDGNPDGVLSTVRDGAGGPYSYAYFEGTSMAAPHVAGVIALLKSVRPSLSGAEARDLLQTTAKPISSGSCEVGCGAGLIDAEAALAALQAPAEPNFALSLSPATLVIDEGENASTEVLISRSGGFNDEVAFSIAGLPGGLSASFTPSSTPGNSTRLTLTASTGVEGDYALQVQGVGGGVSRTVPLSVVVRGDDTPVEPSIDIVGTYVFACPVSAARCMVDELPAVQITTEGFSASYTIPDVPAGDYYVYGWNDLNDNGQVDNGEPVGVFPDLNTPSVVNPPASGIDVVMVPALGTQGPVIEGARQSP